MKKKLEEKAQLQSNKGMLPNSNNPYHQGRTDMQQMYHTANANQVQNDSAGKSNSQMQTYANAKDNAGVPRKM